MYVLHLTIDAPIGGCQYASNAKWFNMGYIRSKPVASEGAVTIHYRGGDVCHENTPKQANRSTRINFFCAESEVRNPVMCTKEAKFFFLLW